MTKPEWEWLTVPQYADLIGTKPRRARVLCKRLPPEYLNVIGEGRRSTIYIRSDAPEPERKPVGWPKGLKRKPLK